MKEEVMKFGSLFTGIGGIDLGLEWAGMECAWQVEIDDYCQKVLHKHWPDVPKYRDIREVGGHNLEPVDIIVGGFPCQPFSNAGKQRGKKDDRYLWPEMLRVIRDIQPTWVLGENVTGIIRMALDTVLSNLEGEGYSCQTFVIPACGINARHKRDRVWIVAHSGSIAERRLSIGTQEEESGADVSGENVSDSNSARKLQPKRSFKKFRGWVGNGSWWDVEPNVGRVADGVPNRLDRLKCLGNAVVPQVVAEIGQAIMRCR